MSALDSPLVAWPGATQREGFDSADTHSNIAPPVCHQDLENRLARSHSPIETFTLLRFAETLPPRSVDPEIEFQALDRLAESDSLFLRGAAYRWLAGLHRKDLRYEMRAMLVLKAGLVRETGLSRQRLIQLLRAC